MPELYFHHILVHSDRLNLFQLSALYRDEFATGEADEEDVLRPNACTEDLVAQGAERFLAVLRERPYRRFEGLYRITLKTAMLNTPGRRAHA